MFILNFYVTKEKKEQRIEKGYIKTFSWCVWILCSNHTFLCGKDITGENLDKGGNSWSPLWEDDWLTTYLFSFPLPLSHQPSCWGHCHQNLGSFWRILRKNQTKTLPLLTHAHPSLSVRLFCHDVTRCFCPLSRVERFVWGADRNGFY